MYFRLRFPLTVALMLSISAGVPSGNGFANAPAHLQHEISALHIEGTHLVSANNKEIVLRGINIGGWLVTEDWMCGFSDDKDTASENGSTGSVGRSALQTLEGRFGSQKAAFLMNVWQSHWITSADIDQIRDGGFNLIRVPISYRTLQNADGSWKKDAQGGIDFGRMDWIVHEAALRGIYTIFDLHVWPQQRNDYQKIGRPEGNKIRESMALLWTAIANHYRGNGAIAAFDLINEFPGNWGIQQTFARAIRDGDPDRIDVIEGFTFPEFLKLHAAGIFPNSIFSDHFYGAHPLTISELKSRLIQSSNSPVPVYIGEFLAADFAGATQTMSLSGVSWSSWTYKAVDMGAWGAFNYYSAVKTDIDRDSFEAINRKWSEDLVLWDKPGAPKNYFFNQDRRFASEINLMSPM